MNINNPEEARNYLKRFQVDRARRTSDSELINLMLSPEDFDPQYNEIIRREILGRAAQEFSVSKQDFIALFTKTNTNH